ncbi:thioredoxin reductase [Desulfocucumis palustris]|uniref:Thioredoxin reductase n=1 Tax=Desulfocucumis palustris TaxID=1898651 RepID=A0A2L2XBT5_9FIRM|nr:VWA domain-containing protein [Desulfocucumis palustris]GBF33552.1 thioredoxin reductase [Desulfocucumis palustris]
MFSGFFYVLRDQGVPVTPTEWMTLMDALNQGLAGPSLSGLYYLARSVLVKSETHYDRYDQAFANYFKGVETTDKLADQVARWLEKSLPRLKIDPSQRVFKDWDLEELKKALEERLAKQKEEHHGGSQWIGTGGTSRFGHSGYNPAGIRIGGESGNRSAVKVAAERRYRDFRADETINTRQFEVALKKLRQLSANDEGPREDLDIDETVEATCKRAGLLELVWEKPRKNTLKLVLMMDSGGSMNPFSRLCSQLFTAASRANHFKDIKFFYFHNCVYDNLFLDPFCSVRNSVKTRDVLRDLSQDYRLIMVGDASMAPSELLMAGGALDWGAENEEPGLAWLERLNRHFHHSVWLNPLTAAEWPPVEATYDTIAYIRRLFPMFELTVEGLERAVNRLKVNK